MLLTTRAKRPLEPPQVFVLGANLIPTTTAERERCFVGTPSSKCVDQTRSNGSNRCFEAKIILLRFLRTRYNFCGMLLAYPTTVAPRVGAGTGSGVGSGVGFGSSESPESGSSESSESGVGAGVGAGVGQSRLKTAMPPASLAAAINTKSLLFDRNIPLIVPMMLSVSLLTKIVDADDSTPLVGSRWKIIICREAATCGSTNTCENRNFLLSMNTTSKKYLSRLDRKVDGFIHSIYVDHAWREQRGVLACVHASWFMRDKKAARGVCCGLLISFGRRVDGLLVQASPILSFFLSVCARRRLTAPTLTILASEKQNPVYF